MPPERSSADEPREWLNLTVLEKAGTQIPDAIRGVESLTRYAVITRYPGLTEPVTEAHYHEALAFAEEVVRWAAQRIAPSQSPG